MSEQDKTLKQATISDLLKFKNTADIDTFFVLLWEMAIETKKYGDNAGRISIAGLSQQDIDRRVHRMDFAREILRLLPDEQRARIAHRILK